METAFSPAVNASVFPATRAGSATCERRGAKWPIAMGMADARLREFASVTTRNGPETPVRREPVRIRLAMIGANSFENLTFTSILASDIWILILNFQRYLLSRREMLLFRWLERSRLLDFC